MIVLDASLAVKLLVHENDSDDALYWYRTFGADLLAPDLIAVEVAQAIVRRVNMRQLSRDDARRMIATWAEFLDDVITLSSTDTVRLGAAAEIAMSIGHPVEDCLYLALAIEQGCTLVTCDARFAAKARSLHPAIRLLTDYAS